MFIAEEETKLGKLFVKKSGWTVEGYPGFLISLERNGEVVSVLMEVDETGEIPECKVHVWDTTGDDPIADFRGRPLLDELRLEMY